MVGALLVPIAAGIVGCSAEDGDGPDPTLTPTSATTSPVWSMTTTTPTTAGASATTSETSGIWPGTPSPTAPAGLPPISDDAPGPGGHGESNGPWVPYMPAMTPFDSCAAARAAGVAPLHRGDPGYSPSLDRDGDGVACE